MNKEQENTLPFSVEVKMPTLMSGCQYEMPLIYSFEHSLTVGELMIELGISPQAVGLIVVNGAQGEVEDVIPNNAKVRLFPQMDGG